MEATYDMNQRARELTALWIKGEHDSVLNTLDGYTHALAVAVYRNLRDAQDRATPRSFGAADLYLALLDARGEGAL
jgi:hypothetical protein